MFDVESLTVGTVTGGFVICNVRVNGCVALSVIASLAGVNDSVPVPSINMSTGVPPAEVETLKVESVLCTT